MLNYVVLCFDDGAAGIGGVGEDRGMVTVHW